MLLKPVVAVRYVDPRQVADGQGPTSSTQATPVSSPSISRASTPCAPVSSLASPASPGDQAHPRPGTSPPPPPLGTIRPVSGRARSPVRQAHLVPPQGAVPHTTVGTIEDTFRAYCWGKPDMDGKSFAKLCKDCQLVDVSLSPAQIDIIFSKVLARGSGQRRMGLHPFMAALKLIAEKKGMDTETVSRVVAASNGPVLKSTKAGAVRFHDDKSMYTGTHLHGGPDTGSKTTSVDQRRSQDWFNSLRSDGDTADALPDMVLRQLRRERAESGSRDKENRSIGGRSASPMPDGKLEMAQRRSRRMPSVKNRAPKDSDEVTMVFTDVQGSTNLWEANPSAMEQALRLHDSLIRQVLAVYSGYEVTTEGDAFQLAFHDAIDAISFCLDVQSELVKVEWPAATLGHRDSCISEDGAWAGLRVRMGVHSGRPAAVTKHEVTGRWRYSGPSVALAKAVEEAAHGGQILVSSGSFSQIDGQLTQLGSPQVLDVGEHLLRGHGLGSAEAPGESGTVAVRLLQLVPGHLAYDHDAQAEGRKASGRCFPAPASLHRISPGFAESPSGSSITLAFLFTRGAQDLVASCPALAGDVLGMLRRCVRDMLQAGDGHCGYECQEDEGAFMLAFHTTQAAATFAAALQRALPTLPWPEELHALGPAFAAGLRVAIGALSGGYTSRRPHTSTGRADYFGTIVNRTARIAAAAHGGQVLIGGNLPADFLSGISSDRSLSLDRLGAFQLKGIDSPMVLHELRFADASGCFETFPEPKTRGRLGN